MDTAIHKKTGKHVSTYQLVTSLEWKGKEKDEFIAPYHGVGNWDWLKKEKNIEEVKVTFIKNHWRNYESGIKTFVVNHFRIITEGAIENPLNESEEHLLAKEHIYSKCIVDEIILNIPQIGKKKLSNLSIVEDIRLEGGVGKKRADVLVTFKERIPIYGKGIAFEVQISPQKNNKTIERNYDRASQDYSIVWIWSDELNPPPEEFNLVPCNEALKIYKEQILTDINKEVNDIHKRTKEDIEDIRYSMKGEVNDLRLKREQLKEDINSSIDILKKIQEQVQEETQDSLKQKVKESIDNFKFSEHTEKYFKDNLPAKLQDYLIQKDSIINTGLNIKIDEIIEKNINKENINSQLNERMRDYLKNYNPEIQKKIDIQNENFLKELKKETQLKVQGDLKKIYISEIVNLVKERVDKNIQELLNNKLIKLKEETIDNYSKNKISYYLKCPKCNEDKHVMLFNISSDGKLICNKCKEGDNGAKKG